MIGRETPAAVGVDICRQQAYVRLRVVLVTDGVAHAGAITHGLRSELNGVNARKGIIIVHKV